MNKKKLLKLLNNKEERKTALLTKADTTEDIAELRSINAELEILNSEIADFKEMIAEIEAEERQANQQQDSNIAAMGNESNLQAQQVRNTNLNNDNNTGLNPMSSYFLQGQSNLHKRKLEPEDKYGTLEYRKAFMKFCTTGEITPELRNDTVTTTGDVSAIIPSTILNEVIKKITSYGQIFNRVRKLNVKGGLTIPILSLKPTATWIGENKESSKQKVTANTNVSFSYYGLECKISTSLLCDTVMLNGFENTITDLIVEAMTKALDLAILNGSGTGQPLGIIKDSRIPAKQIITLKSDEIKDWGTWKKKVFAKMPLAYKGEAEFYMASGTFEGYIDGMTDKNGQPVGRVNYGIVNSPQESFGGKSVIQVEDDIIVPYDDANSGDVIAVYCNLKNYGFNSNMEMRMYRYFDQDTNEWVDKGILIADGKLIDPNGVVIIKKGSDVTSGKES
ncbi:phage major capsid protein [Clostridium botulinum D/C]|uniref:phage major capsid protein n=1 Tax=Clostridium botulinum TaxID=1491 RepID=UPI001E4E9D63|nr:phage major capsid protein [Clostridium botulinum]MCD3234320.1 phage major capsid protein [Clostridium botulinum D/C]MCD3240304.1 phage major capsid protein [Clostridium botulinum D/C]MCD3267739.1 phage major capsid protein [Clostridium botulinum D/C]MCD3306136.1 phage major capsid protein [Clostridium botulinum D/C]MCD3314920.1 phage major capsid protein [Clostridium botulinum D/C]